MRRETCRLTRGGQGVASAVLEGDHLVASSVPCDDHCAMAARAGMEMDECGPYRGDRVGTLRMWMAADSVTVEFWRPGEGVSHPDALSDDEGAEDLPPAVDTARLDRVLEHVRGHGAMRNAFPDGIPEITVMLLCNEGRPTWCYGGDARGLHLEEEEPEPVRVPGM